MATQANKKPTFDISLSAVTEWHRQMQLAYPERAAFVQTIIEAAIISEHVIGVGDPGTGKSQVATEFSKAIAGKTFVALLDRFTTPDHLLGGLDLMALKQGRTKRVLTDRLGDCTVAILEELFNANPQTLKAMQMVVNERLITDDGKLIKVPLRLALGVTNVLPAQGDGLEALDDRFIYRHEIKRMQDRNNWLMVMAAGGPLQPVTAKFTLEHLDVLAERAASMVVPMDVLEAVDKIRMALPADIPCSDRKWIKCFKAIRARAVMSGSTSVSSEHLTVLHHLLWLKISDQQVVKELVAQHVSVWLRKLQKAQAAVDQLQKTQQSAVAGHDGMRDTIGEISKVANALHKINEDVLGEINKEDAAKEKVRALRVRINDIIIAGSEAATRLGFGSTISAE